MATTGDAIVRLGRRHLGEAYVLGALAPKDNARWTGPWDCAEFASWLIFQTGGVLYGCASDAAAPGAADAFTGYWARDVERLGQAISIDDAARTPGAAVLRRPQPGAFGHIAISDGRGGTVEAHSTKLGVIASTIAGRRWDVGILVPGIDYSPHETVPSSEGPAVVVYRLAQPRMTGGAIKAIQRALKERDFNPGPIDGEFGPLTHAAVVSFQAARRLVIDGEVGPATTRALGVTLPDA